jgi:ABC-type nitrate/sulfonate/bicarbonate transport system substrate-binding protein
MIKRYTVTGFNGRIIMLSLVAFVALLARMAAGAETAKPTPLRLAYSAISVNQAIPWISYEAGHFRKYGLDVELIHASSILAPAGASRRRSCDCPVRHRRMREL